MDQLNSEQKKISIVFISQLLMSHERAQSSLLEAMKLFDAIVSRREKLIKDSRDIISLSAKAIVFVHSSKFDEASGLMDEARKRLEGLRKIAGADLARYLSTPEQEFVECSVFFSVSRGKEIPSRRLLRVSPSSYVLGMLDAIGELKRAVYDRIRKDQFDDVERIFAAMENLYLALSPFSIYDNIAPGVKRKLDVSRILIEDTRATVTEEARRRNLIGAINDLATRLGEPLVKPAPRNIVNRDSLEKTAGADEITDELMQE